MQNNEIIIANSLPSGFHSKELATHNGAKTMLRNASHLNETNNILDLATSTATIVRYRFAIQPHNVLAVATNKLYVVVIDWSQWYNCDQ